MKSLLMVSRSAPWAGASAREALEIVLAAAAFDLPVALLFLDDGLFQLTANQQAHCLQQKDLNANLKALPLFGIDDCYAAKSSLMERGLKESEVHLAVHWLDDKQIAELFSRYHQIITL
ncbi:sulfur relay protein TusC [Ventosimonas gracilis]|uniref:Sulfur relay protein TusC n=1 Tax=Ventosimonas gracilis TaxID=1680762 RepID=A0A139SR92_9GAMM|nr:sulfurtransferase complex subunit TusC [Ventosimonas gracilis]KXU37063.1 sulfur relay protein TusC [Ventosimonas gracilis]